MRLPFLQPPYSQLLVEAPARAEKHLGGGFFTRPVQIKSHVENLGGKVHLLYSLSGEIQGKSIKPVEVTLIMD